MAVIKLFKSDRTKCDLHSCLRRGLYLPAFVRLMETFTDVKTKAPPAPEAWGGGAVCVNMSEFSNYFINSFNENNGVRNEEQPVFFIIYFFKPIFGHKEVFQEALSFRGWGGSTFDGISSSWLMVLG